MLDIVSYCTRSNVKLKSARYFKVFNVGFPSAPVTYSLLLKFEN